MNNMSDIDELLPACFNCRRWKYYERGWGFCNSRHFKLTHGGKILTNKKFQCIDYDTIYTYTDDQNIDKNEIEDEEDC